MRPGGNPDIVKAGMATRLKKGHPGSKNQKIKPWSVRNQLQYISAQPINMQSAEEMEKSLDKLKRHKANKHGEIAAARAIAIRMLERVLKKMEPPLVKEYIENIDGKMTQPIDLNPPKKSQTSFVTLEEAAAAWAEDIKK